MVAALCCLRPNNDDGGGGVDLSANQDERNHKQPPQSEENVVQRVNGPATVKGTGIRNNNNNNRNEIANHNYKNNNTSSDKTPLSPLLNRLRRSIKRYKNGNTTNIDDKIATKEKEEELFETTTQKRSHFATAERQELQEKPAHFPPNHKQGYPNPIAAQYQIPFVKLHPDTPNSSVRSSSNLQTIKQQKNEPNPQPASSSKAKEKTPPDTKDNIAGEGQHNKPRKSQKSSRMHSRRKKGNTHERSSSWAFSSLKKMSSTSSLTSPTGAFGNIDALPASSSRTIDTFVIQELGAQSANVVFGPRSTFQGNVVMGVKTQLKNATVSVTFQGVVLAKEIASPFLTITEEMWRGDMSPGRQSFIFGLQFPAVNLPPSSDDPQIAYSLFAKVSYGADSYVSFVSKPFKVTFVPLVDPFAVGKPPAAKPPTSPSQVKDGKKPNLRLDTGVALTPTTPSNPYFPSSSAQSSNTETVSLRDDDDSLLAELRIKMPQTNFLPGDDVIAQMKLCIGKGRDLPKTYTTRIEEVRKFRMEVKGKDIRNTSEVIKTLSSQKLSINWQSASKEPTNAAMARLKDELSPGASVDEVTPKAITHDGSKSEKADTNQSSESSKINQEMTVLRNTIHVRLPNFNSFIAQSLLPTCTLPLSGEDDLPVVTPSTPSTKKAPSISSNQSTSCRDVFMEVSHRLHITIPLSSARIALKRPTIELFAPIILGNRDPMESKRPVHHRENSNNDSHYPPSFSNHRRRNSSSTNPSFLLTTAPDDNYPAESPGSGTSTNKVPSFRLNDYSDDGETSAAGAGVGGISGGGLGAGNLSSTSIVERSGFGYSGNAIWDMPGSPLWIEVRSPNSDKEGFNRMLTLAETDERPFFLKE